MPSAGELIRASDARVGGLASTPGETSAVGSSANSSTFVDYTGLSTTFEALSGHYYEVKLYVPRVDCSATGMLAGIAIRDGDNNVLEGAISPETFTAALVVPCPTVLYVATFTPGTQTVKASHHIFSGTGTITPQPSVTGGVRKCRIYAIDLGIPPS